MLGPNGAGKSTTIGMLNSSVTPSAGRAVLGGLDVARDPMGTRAISSVVFQDAVVDQPLTGRQNLDAPRAAVGRPHRATGAVASTSSPPRPASRTSLIAPVATYSGGQRRRLEIVRALLSEPRVLFLDEPTVGLDTRIRHDLFDAIATLRERTGVTIILTTHHLEEAERLCDRIAIVDGGRIVACDTPARLLATSATRCSSSASTTPAARSSLLRDHGVARRSTCSSIGGTVTVALRAVDEHERPRLLEDRVDPTTCRATRAAPPSTTSTSGSPATTSPSAN